MCTNKLCCNDSRYIAPYVALPVHKRLFLSLLRWHHFLRSNQLQLECLEDSRALEGELSSDILESLRLKGVLWNFSYIRGPSYYATDPLTFWNGNETPDLPSYVAFLNCSDRVSDDPRYVEVNDRVCDSGGHVYAVLSSFGEFTMMDIKLNITVETTQTKHHGVLQLVLAKILAKPTLTSVGEQRFDEQENPLECLSLADEPAFKKVPRGSPLDVAVPRDIRN
ncbi:hypothetical protein ACSQ67_024189 [Phaseolus vulgaris]